MVKIGIILGTTRPGRNGEAVARWVLERAQNHEGDAEYELVDLADYPLPHLNEPIPAGHGGIYQHDHTKEWAAKVSSLDAFIFVTPEYNRSIPGVLKNALDYIGPEWQYKAAGIVSYGGMGGARASEHLRAILTELRVMAVREQVQLSLITEFKNFSEFSPGPWQADIVSGMLNQVIKLSNVLSAFREPSVA